MRNIFIMVLIFHIAKGALEYNYKNIECSSSNKTCIKPFCYVKAYSGTYSTINFGCESLSKAVNQAYINSTTSFRQITTYRQILATPPIEYCALTKDITNLPSIWKTIALEFFKRNPNSLLICPLKEWKLYNITIENAMHLLWPSGEYKNVIHLYNDQDEKLLKFTFNVQLINTK